MREIAAPAPGIGFLQVNHGNGPYTLAGNFQHPLFKTRLARRRLCLEQLFLFRRQLGHNCSPALSD
jgi:hypothetical protein